MYLLLRLASFSLLLALSWPVVAIPNLDSSDEMNTEILLQELTNLPVTGSSAQQPSMALQSPQQAKKTLEKLQTELRKNGELRNILVLAPRIMELLPDDPDIRYMYAIALAAKGDVASAEMVLIKDVPQKSGTTALYASLAKAAIAKTGGKLKAADKAARVAVAIDAKHPYAYNLLGQIDAARKDYAKALANFQTVVRLAPEFAAAWSNLGAVQLLQGDSSLAATSFSTAIELAPLYCAPRIGRAVVSADQGYTESAITDLEACVAAEPEQLQASKQLASLYLQVGRLDDAEKIAGPLLSSETRFSRVMLADIDLRRNQPKSARKQLQAIADPDAQVHYLLSFCDMLEGRDMEAIKHIEQAEALQPNSVTFRLARLIYVFYAGNPVDQESLVALGQDKAIGKLAVYVSGNVQAAANNMQAAYRLWTKAADLLPGFTLEGLTLDEVSKAVTSNEQRHLALGMLFYLKNLYPASLSEFNRALAVNADSFLANYFAALAVAQNNDRDQAGKYLERSLKKAPGFFPANYMLGEIYLQNRDIDSAMKHYQAATDSKPDGGVLIKLGLLSEQKGRKEEAVKAYRKFIEHYPDNFIGYNQLAWMYTRDGEKLNEALKLAKKADGLQPDNVSINDTLGWIYFQKNNYKQAEKYLQHANVISKNGNADVLFHLASLKNAQGEIATAKALLEKAFNISKSFESAAQARKLQQELSAK